MATVSGESAFSVSGPLYFPYPASHTTGGIWWCADPTSRLTLDGMNGAVQLRVRQSGSCPAVDVGHGLPPIVDMVACFAL